MNNISNISNYSFEKLKQINKNNASITSYSLNRKYINFDIKINNNNSKLSNIGSNINIHTFNYDSEFFFIKPYNIGSNMCNANHISEPFLMETYNIGSNINISTDDYITNYMNDSSIFYLQYVAPQPKFKVYEVCYDAVKIAFSRL